MIRLRLRPRFLVVEECGRFVIPIERPRWTRRGAERAVRRAYARARRLRVPVRLTYGVIERS